MARSIDDQFGRELHIEVFPIHKQHLHRADQHQISTRLIVAEHFENGVTSLGHRRPRIGSTL